MATRSIKTKLSLDGEREWKEQMKGVNSALRTLQSELKLSSSEFRGQANSMAALKSKQDILQRQYDQQKQKVKDLTTALEEAQRLYADSPEKVDKYQRMLNVATVQLNGMDDELKKNGRLLTEATMSSDGCAHSIDEFGHSIDDAADEALSFGDVLKANVASQAIISGLKALASAAKSIGDAFLDVAKEGINLASDLGEVQNVVDTTFGEKGAKKIYEWADAAAEAYGMSSLDAQRYTGSLGAMLKSQGMTKDATLEMSTAMVGLAGDMASFYNLDTEEAFEKLRSGISGEAEPLKALGINMSVANLEAYALAQGIDTAFSEMTQAEQTTLRYNYIMEQTADAQGDFAKTSDSYANQQRILQLNIENLKASLGEKLLPTVTEVTSAFNDLLSGNIDIEEFFHRLAGANKTVTKAFQTLAPVVTAGTVALVAYKSAVAISSLIGALSKALKGATSAMKFFNLILGANPVLKVVSAIAALTAALVVAWKTNDEFRAKVTNAWNKVKNAVTSVVDSIKKAFHSLGVKFTEIYDTITGQLKKFKEIGLNIVSGIWDGISGGYDWIVGKIQGWVGDVLGFFKNILGIHSPSTVLRDQVGKFMGEGVTEGFIDNIDAEAMAKAIPTNFDIAAEVHGSTYGSISNAGAGLSNAPAGYYTYGELTDPRLWNLLDDLRADIGWIRANGLPVVLDDGTVVGLLLPRIDRELGRMADDRNKVR